MAEKCTNTSDPPPSTVMKPKPFSALNHLTVPCAMFLSFRKVYRPRALRATFGRFRAAAPFADHVERRGCGPRTQKLSKGYTQTPAVGEAIFVGKIHTPRGVIRS